MGRSILHIGCLALIAASPFAAFAQTDQIAIGGNVGVFVPTNKATRDALGNSWISWGIGPVPIVSRDGRRISSDLGFVAHSNNGNRLFMIKPTIGVSQTFGDATKAGAVPFIAVRTGPAYANYSITTNGVKVSGSKIGWNGNAEVGIIFNQNFILSARYDVMSQFSGFNFNGWTLSARFQIARF